MGTRVFFSGLLTHFYGHRSPPCFTVVCALFHGDKSTACVYDHNNLNMHFPRHCIIAAARIQPCLLVRPLENNDPVQRLLPDI